MRCEARTSIDHDASTARLLMARRTVIEKDLYGKWEIVMTSTCNISSMFYFYSEQEQSAMIDDSIWEIWSSQM